MSETENPRAVMGDNTMASGHLKSLIERIERLEEDKTQVSEDIKDVYAEAKGTGYDVKTMRKIVAMRRQDKGKLVEQQKLLEMYANALGMGIFG